MSDTLYVTPAQVLAAKLALELSEEAGEAPDEALIAIANAQVVPDKQFPAGTQAADAAVVPDDLTKVTQNTSEESVASLFIEAQEELNLASEIFASTRGFSERDRDQLKQRIDQVQDDLNQALEDAALRGGKAADRARSMRAQMRADAAARMEEIKAKINKRGEQLDAEAAAKEAERAEENAADAIDYAVYVLDVVQLALLNALDARANAAERAEIGNYMNWR